MIIKKLSYYRITVITKIIQILNFIFSLLVITVLPLLPNK